MDVVTFLRDYLGITTLSRAQTKVLRETFGKTPGAPFFAIEQLILKVGQGGGKNFTVTPLVIYSIYLWCCLTDPHRYFNMYYTEPFDILNYSQVNAKQARNVFFKTLANQMKQVKVPGTNENWFVKNMGMKIQEYGAKDILEQSMVIPHRDHNRGCINIYCLDSEAKSVEGYTIWITIMDEPSRANTPLKFGRAKAQYSTAFHNQETRHPPGKRLTIVFAYPEQETNDLLVELFDQYSFAPAENKLEIKDSVLTAWYHNWVFSGKDKQAKKNAYQKLLKTDPIEANRRFKAIVPPNIYGFFMPHQHKIEECANPNLISPIEYKTTITRRRAMVQGVLKDIDFTALELFKIKGDDKERHWGGDFSLSKDSLVLVSGYAERTEREVEEFSYKIYEKESGRPIDKIVTINCRPVIDTILVWKPMKSKPVDYQNVEDVILDLMGNSFPNSRSLHFDKWNTESIRQKLLDIGIYDCETLPFSNPQQILYGRLFRHLVWSNAIEYVKNDVMLNEMNKLMLINNSKLDHPDGNYNSKDIWDAVSICVYNIIMRTKMGSNLDINTGDPSVDTKATENDETLRILYQQAYKLHIKKKGHPPGNTDVLRNFLIKDMNYRCSIEDVEYMRELWLDWVYDTHNRVLGHKKYKRVMGFESEDPFATDEELLKDLEVVDDGIIGRF